MKSFRHVSMSDRLHFRIGVLYMRGMRKGKRSGMEGRHDDADREM